MLNPHLLALARRRTYHLFGRLFLEGAGVDFLPQLQAIPELAQLIEEQDPDQLAAAHYQVTSVAVFPYESIFLDPTGLLGGTIAEQVGALYRQTGFAVDSDADHIGHELQFMSYLCAAEADALAAGDSPSASLWSSRQRSFLAAHLLAWLPPLVISVQRSQDPFYGRLAALTLELCADHHSPAPVASSPLSLPAAPDLTGEERDLKQIARQLSSPPISGFFLSKDAISDLARHLELPRGFGDRAQLLANLLRTSGQYDLAPTAIDDLASLGREWQAAYEQQQRRFPGLAPWIHPWRDRLDQTIDALELIADTVRQMS